MQTVGHCWFSISVLLTTACDRFADKRGQHPIFDVRTSPQPRSLGWPHKQHVGEKKALPSPTQQLAAGCPSPVLQRCPGTLLSHSRSPRCSVPAPFSAGETQTHASDLPPTVWSPGQRQCRGQVPPWALGAEGGVAARLGFGPRAPRGPARAELAAAWQGWGQRQGGLALSVGRVPPPQLWSRVRVALGC